MDTFFKPRFIGLGMNGIVYKVSDCVAVKVPWRKQDEYQKEGFEVEQEHIKMLQGGSADDSSVHDERQDDRHPPCPYLVSVFYQVPEKAIFMMRAMCDLRAFLHRRYVPDMERTTRWMGQLCGGMAFLESRGVVHGDLRPDNVLVDGNGNVRLADFGDSVMPIGEKHFGISEPFGRQLGPDEGVPVERYEYGIAGPRTENFALGSVYYCLLRGHYPYEKEEYDRETLMRMFCLRQFPALGEFPEPDEVIARCWDGGYYKSVAELEQVFRDQKDGTEWYRFEPDDAAWIAEQRQACEEWTAAGNLEDLLAARTR